MCLQVPCAYTAKGRGELELHLLRGFGYQYTRCVFFPSKFPITTEFQNIKLSCLGLVDFMVSNVFLPVSLGLIPAQVVFPALSPQLETLPFLKKLPTHN